MRLWRIAVAVSIITALSCMQHSNPFDINDPNYDPPKVFIDSSSVNNGDSTALGAIALRITGNKPEVTVRWRLDSLQWSAWREQGTVTVSGYATGKHTITAQGWYGGGGQIADTAMTFVKVNTPTVAVDTSSLLDDSLVRVNAGTLCTLRVSAGGSGALQYLWYHGGTVIDSTSGNALVVGPFAAKDSGSYFVVVRNKWGAAASDTVLLRYVPPVNNPPVAVRDSFTVAEDNTLTITMAQSILKNDTDKDGDTLTAVLVDSTRNGALALAANGTFTYRPNANFFGADSFTYKARDTKAALSAAVGVRITVTPVNDAPVVAKNDHITLNEGQKVTVPSSKVSVTDVDNPPSALAFTLKRPPAHGAMLVADTSLDSGKAFTQKNIDDGVVAYRHDGSETTKDTAIFSISDGSGGRIDTLRVLFDITPVNDTPYFATRLDLSVIEGGSRAITNATLQVKDNDNTAAQLMYTIVSDVVHGQVRKSGVALDAGATFTQQDIDSGRIVYQHDKTKTTRDSLSFTVNDGMGGAIAATWFIIRIEPVNDPPVTIKQDVSTNEDASLTITLSATDPEGAAIAGWEISRQPRHGTLTGSGATRTYTPALYYAGPDTVLFRASDGVNWSDTGMIAITILHVNHAPIWKQSAVDLSVKEGKAVVLDLSAVFNKDPDGDSVTFFKKSGVGTLAGRTWTWTPGFTAAAASPASCVITATDNGTPAMSADIALTITVSDSLCRLTTAVTIGNGTIQTAGTTFDPGTVVQVTANPATDYVFKNWSGDVPAVNQNAATVSITMNGDKSVAATFVKTIETVTLNIGESYVHGTTYAQGYFFASTRTSPAKLLRFSANDLSDHAEITFSAGHDGADQLVYVPTNRKLYVVFGSNSRTSVAEVDPITMAYTEDKINDTQHGSTAFGSGGGQSITSDGSNLYVVNCMWDTTKVYKYSLSTFSSIPVGIAVLDTGYTLGHSIEYSETHGMLYVTNCISTPWAAKVNPAAMQVLQKSHFAGVSFTDDFGLNKDYLFAGMEADYTSPYSGVVFRISRNDVSQSFTINTGVKGGAATGGGQCYAVKYYGNYVWAIFASSPGTLTRIDPVSLEYKNYRLDYNTPNEIVWDGKRLLITYWAQDPGRIQAFDPQYLNGREIP